MTKNRRIALLAGVPTAAWLILAAAAGASSAYFLLCWLTPEAFPTPWGLMTIFLLPLASAATTYIELSKVMEQTSLSSRERERLQVTLSIKQALIMRWICIILIAATLCVLGFMVISTGHILSIWIFSAVVGLIAFSLAMTPFLLLQNKEITEFKIKLTTRSQRKKELASALKRLSRLTDAPI